MKVEFLNRGRAEGINEAPNSTREMAGRHFRYSYDNLGNRTAVNHAINDDANIGNDFTPTLLNQYTSRENNTLPVSGTADYDTTVAVLTGGAGVTADRQGSVWHHDLEVANSSGPWTGDVDVLVSNAAGSQYNTDTRDDAKLPQKSQTFNYDDDGNLTAPEKERLKKGQTIMFDIDVMPGMSGCCDRWPASCESSMSTRFTT